MDSETTVEDLVEKLFPEKTAADLMGARFRLTFIHQLADVRTATTDVALEHIDTREQGVVFEAVVTDLEVIETRTYGTQVPVPVLVVCYDQAEYAGMRTFNVLVYRTYAVMLLAGQVEEECTKAEISGVFQLLD
ncbi:MAG: hypothetical protein WCO52_02075 [bacterium]